MAEDAAVGHLVHGLADEMDAEAARLAPLGRQGRVRRRERERVEGAAVVRDLHPRAVRGLAEADVDREGRGAGVEDDVGRDLVERHEQLHLGARGAAGPVERLLEEVARGPERGLAARELAAEALAGAGAAAYIKNKPKGRNRYVSVKGQNGVSYVVPQNINENTDKDVKLYFRVADVYRNARIIVESDGKMLSNKKKPKL